MKKEELYRRNYKSEKEFLQSVEDYIHFYNTERPHRTLAYRSPKQFEAEHGGNNAMISLDAGFETV